MPRILLRFSNRKQLKFSLSPRTKDFKFFLILYEGENTNCGKRESGWSTLSQYFQVYQTISTIGDEEKTILEQYYRLTLFLIGWLKLKCTSRACGGGGGEGLHPSHPTIIG